MLGMPGTPTPGWRVAPEVVQPGNEPVYDYPSVVSANLLHGFGQFNLRKPRQREREVVGTWWKAFKLPPHSADRQNRIAHQAQRSQILTSSPLSVISLYGSYSLLRCCRTARKLSLVFQNKTSKSVEKVRGYNTGIHATFYFT